MGLLVASRVERRRGRLPGRCKHGLGPGLEVGDTCRRWSFSRVVHAEEFPSAIHGGLPRKRERGEARGNDEEHLEK